MENSANHEKILLGTPKQHYASPETTHASPLIMLQFKQDEEQSTPSFEQQMGELVAQLEFEEVFEALDREPPERPPRAPFTFARLQAELFAFKHSSESTQQRRFGEVERALSSVGLEAFYKNTKSSCKSDYAQGVALARLCQNLLAREKEEYIAPLLLQFGHGAVGIALSQLEAKLE